MKFLLQSVAKVLARSMFFLTGCIGDRLPLPTPKTMSSFIHITLRLYCNIDWGESGSVKLNTRFQNHWIPSWNVIPFSVPSTFSTDYSNRYLHELITVHTSNKQPIIYIFNIAMLYRRRYTLGKHTHPNTHTHTHTHTKLKQSYPRLFLKFGRFAFPNEIENNFVNARYEWL